MKGSMFLFWQFTIYNVQNFKKRLVKFKKALLRLFIRKVGCCPATRETNSKLWTESFPTRCVLLSIGVNSARPAGWRSKQAVKVGNKLPSSKYFWDLNCSRNQLNRYATFHTLFSFFVPSSSIGYPVVYLGFYATCYFTNIFKLRIQKAVQNDNDFHMHLLQNSLPPVLQVYPKSGSDGSSCKYFLSYLKYYFFWYLLDRDESHILHCSFFCITSR